MPLRQECKASTIIVLYLLDMLIIIQMANFSERMEEIENVKPFLGIKRRQFCQKFMLAHFLLSNFKLIKMSLTFIIYKWILEVLLSLVYHLLLGAEHPCQTHIAVDFNETQCSMSSSQYKCP